MPERRPRLEGKVAIVTGAGSSGPGVGNGKATAVLFAREGAKVLLVDAVLERASALLFTPVLAQRGRGSRLAVAVLLAGLFAGGVAHWLVFLNFGDLSLLPGDSCDWRGDLSLLPGESCDWRKELFYYSIIRQAVEEGTIPYSVGGSYTSGKFLGNLEPVFSPQVVLLPLVTVGQFVLVNTLLMYALGFAGSLLLMRRYNLSPASFLFLFLLFNFSGHITSHISVGHIMWNGYFLLPFFVLLVLKLVEGSSPSLYSLPVLLGVVLFGMVLQGSFHIFIWCSLFLVLVGLVNRRLLAAAFLSVAFGLVLSAFRLLPAALVYGGHRGSYASGFPTLSTFVDALTTINAHKFEHLRGPLYDVGWWEHDTFIGIIGLVFVVMFGVYYRFSGRPAVQGLKFQALDLPLLLMVLFSFGVGFDLLSDLRIPFLSLMERVPSRLFVIPLLVLIVISAIRMEALLRELVMSNAARLAVVGTAVLLAHSLAVHSWFWRISGGSVSLEDSVTIVFNDPSQHDPVYSAAVMAGAAVTVAAIFGLGWLYVRDRSRGPRGGQSAGTEARREGQADTTV